MIAVSKKISKDTSGAKEVLTSFPLISVGRGQAMWQIMNEIASDKGIRKPEIECQSIESALALVKRGIGAMLVPSYFDVESNDDIRFLPLENSEEYKRTVCLFYRKEQFLTQAEKDFIDCVVKREEKK